MGKGVMPGILPPYPGDPGWTDNSYGGTFAYGGETRTPEQIEADRKTMEILRRRGRIERKHLERRARGLWRVVMSKFEDRMKARLWWAMWITIAAVAIPACLWASLLAWHWFILWVVG